MEYQTKKLYAGIDGGGSKTLAIVVDEAGHEIGRGQAGGSNYQSVGAEKAVSHIQQALQQASGGTLPISGMCVGLAGVDRPADRDLMLNELVKLGLCSLENVWLGNDGELILLALPNGYGLGLIGGTGSIALGKDAKGNSARAGGWGYLIGDEGSGYDLGRRAVQTAVRAADGRSPETSLLPAILAEWQLSEPTQLVGVVYSPATKVADFAKLARLVAKEAKAGDATAQKLLKQAARELAKAVEAVAGRLDFGGNAPNLALAGGFLLNEPILRRMVLRQLGRTIQIGITCQVSEPAYYAAQAALTLFKS